jgi:putative methionine-R-sulfoxide reductase with GAF domain
VGQFAGYIACDPNSKSELAVPMFDGDGELRAVLDMDSEFLAAFDATDVKYCERLAARLTGAW